VNAFQHYIKDIQRFPMCLYETTSAEISRQAHVQIDRKAKVFEALGESQATAADLVKITGLTQGQVAHVLSSLQKINKVTTIPHSPGKPKLWVRT
jgi:predicted Rossmann fold nucleotide-binding protein DprA/Smf involved in DNA uptake